MREVAHLDTEIHAVMKAVGFGGTVEEFRKQVDEKQPPLPSTADVLREYRDIAKRVDPLLPQYFRLLPRTPFGIEAIPPFRGTSVAYYQPPATDGWNHGTVGSQINTTWLGMAGPGVAHLGADNSAWSDHTNIQPTMMALLRLPDDYAPDGRVLGEPFTPAARPAGMRVYSAKDLLRVLRIRHQTQLVTKPPLNTTIRTGNPWYMTDVP